MEPKYDNLDESISAAMPAATHKGLIAWQEETSSKISLIRIFTNGYTGAFVGLAAISDKAGDRKVIVKASESADGDESAVHDRAVRSSPTEFVEKHLVMQALDPLELEGDWLVMFQDIAGGGIGELVPLSSYSGRSELRTMMPEISRSVVFDWNPAPRVERITVRAFLESQVKTKLSANGRLRAWLEEQLGEEAVEAEYLLLTQDPHEQPVYNPCHIWAPNAPAADVHLDVPVGNGHGDLHLENVLVKPRNLNSSEAGYRLIDLATFSPEAPLTRDIANLYLSEVEHAVSELSAPELSELQVAVASKNSNVSAKLEWIVDLWKSVSAVGNTNAADRGYLDDWRLQMDLALAGAALQSASREHRSREHRLWFFGLAARVLDFALTAAHLLPPVGTTARAYRGEFNAPSSDPNIARTITMACGNFTGEALSIALFNDVPANSNMALSDWDLIIDFNPLSDQGGLFHAAHKNDHSNRWATNSDYGGIVRGVTAWLPGSGLALPSGKVPEYSLREWRVKVMLELRKTLSRLIVEHAGPIAVVLFGPSDFKTRAIIEFLVDHCGDRAGILHVGPAEDPTLLQLDAEYHAADPRSVLAAMPPKPPRSRSDLSGVTIPALDRGERIRLSEMELVRYSEVGHLLHSGIEAIPLADEDLPGGFYQGRPITWLELAEERDIPRRELRRIQADVSAHMSTRGTRRHLLTHRPGSGGTTVARRLAWNLHGEHPILVLDRISSLAKVVGAISDLAERTHRQCLVLIENVDSGEVDELFNRLRARTTPVTLLVVQRRPHTGKSGDPKTNVAVDELGREEQGHFTRIFSSYADSTGARGRLASIGTSTGDPAIPFFYALNAFQTDYRGLSAFVGGFLAKEPEEVLAALTDIALLDRFGRRSLPSAVVGRFFDINGNVNLRVRQRLHRFSDGLLLEGPIGSWRMSHPLVAEEFLRQCLSSEVDADANSWMAQLSIATCDLIIRLAEAYDGEEPSVVSDILRHLLIVREGVDVADSDDYRYRFSELVSSVPTYSGRDEIFSTLVEYFPDDAHYLGHYARLKSYEGEDYVGASALIDQAMDILPDDNVLLNIKAIVARNELSRMLSDRPSKRWHDDVDYARTVSALISEAIYYFRASESIDGSTEFNAYLIIRLTIRAVERLKPKEESFARFLVRPSSRSLASAVDEAEDAADRILDLSGDFKLSDRVRGALEDLKGLRDDYAGMLQGWRNVLDTATGTKGPIRNRLARLYWERSQGGLDVSNCMNALGLLAENLRDDPFDVRSIRLWLRAARFSGASLDAASIHVSNYVHRDGGREAFFWDWALSTMLLLNGRRSELREHAGKLARMRSAFRDQPYLRDIVEWWGHGEGMAQFVSARDPRLSAWDRQDREASGPRELRRVRARVVKLAKDSQGWLLIDEGVEAFFAPAAAGLRPGLDENALVEAFIGFSRDGLVAWNVRRTV